MSKNYLEDLFIEEVKGALNNGVTEEFVKEKILEAQLGGGEVDLSDYAKQEEVTQLKSDLNEYEERIDGLEYVVDSLLESGGGQSIEVNGHIRVPHDDFELGGYQWDVGLIDSTNRARFIIDGLENDSKILFNGTAYSINYFVVKTDGVNPVIYSPNVWDSSGEIIIEGVTNSSEQSVVVMAKSNRGSNVDITEAELNTMNLETEIYVKSYIKTKNTVDLFMFMGQSNMAGRGSTNSEWTESYPILINGAGYEFKAIFDPTTLHPISEPFGANENKTNGIDDGDMKTGSMVTSFVNAYYEKTGIPIVGVSASKGGSGISEWQPNGAYLTDAIQRLSDCVVYLENKGYTIRHKFMLWCQGESDGDARTTKDDYITMFNAMLSEMVANGIEKLFMVRIGECNVSNDLDRYSNVIQWQNEIAQTNKNVVMVSTALAGMRERGLMKDSYHYYQAGYNEVGTYAGINTAFYVINEKEPTMYDPKNDGLYFSKKN